MPKGKILIIDDEKDLVKTLTLMLQARDFLVSSTNNGQEGFTKAKSERPNLILMDIMAPSVDGFGVCMKLKADKDTKHIPIVIITAGAERESIIRCHNIGVSDVLVKPFNLPTLLGKLGKIIGK
jgi:DNA-binding response OmpR family regulator